MTPLMTLQAGAALALVTGSLLAASPASADTPTCDGQPATIVAAPAAKAPWNTVINGTPGPDVIYIPADPSDSVYYTVNAGAGDDIVCGDGEVDADVNGGDGDDHLEVNAWNVDGGNGDDTIVSDAQDSIEGGAGDDHITVLAAPHTTGGQPPFHWVRGGPGNDAIEGSPDSDWISDDTEHAWDHVTSDGADVIHGNGGDDVILLDGGNGTTGSPDFADGGPGHDEISYADSGAGVKINLATGTAVGSGGAQDHFINNEGWVIGSSHADTIRGTSGPDWIDGGSVRAKDTIISMGGNDHISATVGVVWAGSGDDVFDPQGSPGSGVKVHLGAGNDRAITDGGTATVWGDAGDDSYVLRQSDEFRVKSAFYGGSGRDSVSWAAISPPLTINVKRHRAHWVMRSGEGNYPGTTRFSGVERYRGSHGKDLFVGSARPESFAGGPGNDRMYGGGGNDVLIGGAGHDRAWGGPGHDRCHAEERHGCESR